MHQPVVGSLDEARAAAAAQQAAAPPGGAGPPRRPARPSLSRGRIRRARPVSGAAPAAASGRSSRTTSGSPRFDVHERRRGAQPVDEAVLGRWTRSPDRRCPGGVVAVRGGRSCVDDGRLVQLRLGRLGRAEDAGVGRVDVHSHAGRRPEGPRASTDGCSQTTRCRSAPTPPARGLRDGARRRRGRARGRRAGARSGHGRQCHVGGEQCRAPWRSSRRGAWSRGTAGVLCRRRARAACGCCALSVLDVSHERQDPTCTCPRREHGRPRCPDVHVAPRRADGGPGHRRSAVRAPAADVPVAVRGGAVHRHPCSWPPRSHRSPSRCPPSSCRRCSWRSRPGRRRRCTSSRC